MYLVGIHQYFSINDFALVKYRLEVVISNSDFLSSRGQSGGKIV